MQSDEILEQRGTRGEASSRRELSRKRMDSLAAVHDRLRSSLEEPLSQGDLWLLTQRDTPYVVLRTKPYFDDALELTPSGQIVVRRIGREIARAPGIYSMIAGHVDPGHDRTDKDWTSCHEAWKQARGVESVLVEAGADPDHVFSVGVWRCTDEREQKVFDRCSPGGPFVVTICFTFKYDEIGDLAWKRIRMD